MFSSNAIRTVLNFLPDYSNLPWSTQVKTSISASPKVNAVGDDHANIITSAIGDGSTDAKGGVPEGDKVIVSP